MADVKKAGKVKWFNTVKGFGFITPDDGSEDIFVHQTAIQATGFRSLREAEPVEYTEDRSDERPKALNVTGPSGAAPQGAPWRVPYGRGRGRGGPRRGRGGAGGEEGATGEDGAAPAGGEGGGRGRGRGRGGRRGGRGGRGRGEASGDGAAAPEAAAAA